MVDDGHSDKRVLLVTMPWMEPAASSLGLATLQPILARAGIAADTLYGSLLFPRTSTDRSFLEHYASFLFVPYLYPEADRETLVSRIVDDHLDSLTLYGLMADTREHAARRTGTKPETLRAQVRSDMVLAGICLDRCFARAAQPRYDVIGFSLTFETQIPSALALARRLKRHNPEVKIAFGGAACLEEQGDGLAASFPELDAVCHCEGESVVVPLVRALRGELPLAEVPGIAYRDTGGTVRHNPSPPLLEDLDRLPEPRYEDYFAYLAESEWSDVKPKLFFETSRGCWWGQKHLCSFCGLNGEGLPFRAKTPERAFSEIRTLYRDYPQATFLQATDNIADAGYFKTVFPRLAQMEQDPDRRVHIFYEVKSNLRAEHLALLRAAGVLAIQPGIESFHDDVLDLMDKGNTGLGQVQLIKWAYQEGVQAVYNILVGNPNESLPAYLEMIDLLPYISHLPPPSGVVRTLIERFSPYYNRPEAFGIRNLRIKPYYRDLFPDPDVDLRRIAYQFDYDHPMYDDPALLAAYREFIGKLVAWSQTWAANRAFYLERGDHLVLVDRRDRSERVSTINGAAADVYRYLDAARPTDAVFERFAHVDRSLLEGMLQRWHAERWIYSARNGKHIAVLPRLLEQPRQLSEVLAALSPRVEPRLRTRTAEGGETHRTLPVIAA